MDARPLDRRYLMRVTIEVYDSADPKARRYATPADHFQRDFTARDNEEARIKQAHCWHSCALAVYNELRED